MPKTFSKCCLKNILPLLFCNIMGMFYRGTFYILLLQQHHQNILRMLHVNILPFLTFNVIGTLFEMINILKCSLNISSKHNKNLQGMLASIVGTFPTNWVHALVLLE